MDKRGKSLFGVILIIVLLIGLSYLIFREGPKLVGMAGNAVLDFSSQESFAGGAYTTSEYVYGIKLSPGSLFGSYESQVIDAGNTAIWNNISWRQELCYQCELPDNQQADSGDYDYSADMTGNVLLFHMNEESGNITDYSGSNNDGEPSEGIGYNVGGKFNQAVGFSEKKKIDVGKQDSLDFSDALTIVAWIKPNDCESDSCVVASRWRENGNKRGWSLVVEDGALRFDSSSDGNWYEGNKAKGGGVANGNWYFAAGVYDSVYNKAYLNGKLVASVDRTNDGFSNSNGVNTYIGYSQKWKNEERGFSGLIDEVAIFSRVLSDEEILNIYKRGILDLALSARICDDSLCDGESFSGLASLSPQNLELNNQYFQYKFDLSTSNASYSPLISSVVIDYDIIINNAPVYSLVPNIKFDAGGSYLINLADYFSDEDNDSLTYNYSAENVSVEISENFANVTSLGNLSGSVVFLADDGENITLSNVVYVSVNITFEEEPEGVEAVTAPVQNIGGGTGYGGGGNAESVNREKDTAKIEHIAINNQTNLNNNVAEQVNKQESENPATITANAVSGENINPLQRFASFFRKAGLTTTQAVKDVGVKVFNLKSDSRIWDALAIAILIVLAIVIVSFAQFMKKTKTKKLPNLTAKK